MNKSLTLLILITIIGAFLRFYNLNWGAPFYFHPDERNIASSISQLHFPDQMNPHFFAYGSLPIYIIYFLGVILNLKSLIFNQDIFFVSFEHALIISRLISAVLSALLIPLIIIIGKKIHSKKAGILAGFFTAISVGFIQFAHFGTFETIITFFSTLLFYCCLKLIKQQSFHFLILTGIISGILAATKISAIPLIIIPFSTIFYSVFFQQHRFSLLKKSSMFTIKCLVIFTIAIVTFFITNPFVLFDFSSFLSGINYESSVALGILPVFYTGGFYDEKPIIFQFTKIYPFLINPLLTLIFIPSFLYITWLSYKKRSASYLFLISYLLLLFLSQAFLFAKWVRYIVPTLPFVYLIISTALADILGVKKQHFLQKIILFIFASICIVYTVSFFITVFIKPDTRLQATLWAKEHIPTNAVILSEAYDLGITPFNPYFPNISLFNFYDLDNDNQKQNELLVQLSSFDYIILPSQRLVQTRLLRPEQFPRGYTFYNTLFTEMLGYKKIYETPCDILCKITYMGNPIFSFEETANIFDRPTVFIFKRITN